MDSSSATSPSEIINIYEDFTNNSIYENEAITTFSTLNVNTTYFVEKDNMLKYSIMFAYLTTFIIGIFLNVIVICVVVFRPQIRNVTNMFILNMASKLPQLLLHMDLLCTNKYKC